MSRTGPEALSCLKPGTLWRESRARELRTVKVVEIRERNVLVQDAAGRKTWISVERFFPKRGRPRKYVPIPDEQL